MIARKRKIVMALIKLLSGVALALLITTSAHSQSSLLTELKIRQFGETVAIARMCLRKFDIDAVLLAAFKMGTGLAPNEVLRHFRSGVELSYARSGVDIRSSPKGNTQTPLTCKTAELGLHKMGISLK